MYSKEHADNIVKLSNVTPSGGSPSDASAKQLVVCMEENMIDHIPTEHVRCCGHQVTWLFLVYHDLSRCTNWGKKVSIGLLLLKSIVL